VRKKEWHPGRVIFYISDDIWTSEDNLKKLFNKRGQFFFLATEFFGLSRKELVTLAGGQINGGKFSCRPIFKGSTQMLWNLQYLLINPVDALHTTRSPPTAHYYSYLVDTSNKNNVHTYI
jgi:hypothetical protein